ncbi:MAG TPA: hypothetical protein VEF04_04800 [Blastocatellia bacterium]|nr:hypothetical protein [Blastocatellia bacterium]
MRLITEYTRCEPNKLQHLAHMHCPTCGKQVAISAKTHSIADDGTVTPSMICPHDCSFHEYIRLAEWAQLMTFEVDYIETVTTKGRAEVRATDLNHAKQLMLQGEFTVVVSVNEPPAESVTTYEPLRYRVVR